MKIGTWNLYFANGDSEIKAGLKVFALNGCSVLGVQELSNDSKEKHAKAVMAAMNYTSTKRNSAITMFVNNATHELVKEEFRLVTEGGQRWEPGTGGSRVIFKGIMGVQVRDKKTGQLSWHLNHHIVPGIEKNGKLRTDVPIRRGVYIAQIAKLTQWVQELRATGQLVTVTGDMNLAWGTEGGLDLARRMANVGLLANWATLPDYDTHTSGRGIDYGYEVNGTFVEQEILGYSGSDHKGLLLTVVHKNEVVKQPPSTTVQDKSAQGIWEVTVDKGSFLWGVPFDAAKLKKFPRNRWMKRKDGYRISTGIGWVKRKDSTGKMRVYLRTRAGWLYAKDYLRKR